MFAQIVARFDEDGALLPAAGAESIAAAFDGRLTHAILLEIFTDSGIGTMVIGETL